MIADIGVSPAVDAVAFSLPVGATSDAITTENGAAVIKVVERPAINDTELAAARDSLRRELVSTAPEPVLHRLHEQGEDVAHDQPVSGRRRPRLRPLALLAAVPLRDRRGRTRAAASFSV